MSRVQPRGVGEGRSQRKERLRLDCDFPIDEKTHRPSGRGTDRHADSRHRPEMPPEARSRHPVHGQQKLPLSAPEHSSLGWHKERRLPPRNVSPGLPQERPLADSDTLPARWRNDAKGEARGTSQGQPRSEGAKVHFREPAKPRLRIPDYDEEEERESELSSDSSSGGTIVNAKGDKHKPDDGGSLLSRCFDLIDHEGEGSGDEDGFVHVHRGSSRGRHL